MAAVCVLQRLHRVCVNMCAQGRSAGWSFVLSQTKCTYSGSSGGDVELGLTADGKTIVCYHPPSDFPYELSQPIPRLASSADTQELVLRSRLSREDLQYPGATKEELSKMFFTTKHRWYPLGQYHRRRMKANPPKDR